MSESVAEIYSFNIDVMFKAIQSLECLDCLLCTLQAAEAAMKKTGEEIGMNHKGFLRKDGIHPVGHRVVLSETRVV